MIYGTRYFRFSFSEIIAQEEKENAGLRQAGGGNMACEIRLVI